MVKGLGFRVNCLGIQCGVKGLGLGGFLLVGNDRLEKKMVTTTA